MNFRRATLLVTLGLSAACSRAQGPLVPSGESTVVFNGGQDLDSGPKAPVEDLDNKNSSLIEPLALTCALQEASETGWTQDSYWKTFISALKNKNAYWLNVTAPITDPKPTCTALAADKRLVLVSSFQLASDQNIHMELVGDDSISIHLWQDAQSSAEVFTANASGFSKDMALRAGRYALILDLTDAKGDEVSGLIGSILNSSGEVIRQTEPGATWCAYLITKEIDLKTFVTEQASQQSCMNSF